MKLQFLVALLIASADEMIQQAKGIWRALKTKQEVPPGLREARLKVCRECPLYSSFLQTCGTPLRKDRLGCFCFMPVKAGTRDNCWAYDNHHLLTLELPPGWPSELNSFPE